MDAQVRKEQSGQQSVVSLDFLANRRSPTNQPLTFRTFSYDLPFHASDANIYPLLSPNGASIIVYGHEKGLTLYKILGQSAVAQALPSAHDHSTVVDKSKDETTRSQPKLEKWLNIELESPVQHVAFPPTSAHFLNKGSHVSDSLVSNVIIAVSCEDLTVILISVPFTAKRDEGKGSQSRSDIKTTYISRGGGHQNSISAVAITWTANHFHKPAKDSRSSSRGRGDNSIDESLSFLVASASTTGSGLLIVCQLPFQPHFTSKTDVHTIIFRQILRLPLLGSTLAFNPSVHSSSDHLSLLLTSPTYGTAKVFDLARHNLLLSKRRRGSESDDATPVTSISTALTLHTAHAGSSPPYRKAILDASWAPSGQAILALLEDGEWGTWHTHLPDSTVGPSDSGQRFTSLGQLTITSPIKGSKTKTSGSLAPMTPHTRKAKSADLFGQTSYPPKSPLSSHTMMGRITLCSSSPMNTAQGDALILSYNEVHHYLPSFQAFCQSVSGEGKVRTAAVPRFQTLPEVRLGGGRRLGTHKLHALGTAKSSGFLSILGQTPDLVVLTDTRLVIFTKVEAQAIGAPSVRNLVFRNIGEGKPTVPRSNDMETLDVEGIDKILDSMEGNDFLAELEVGRKPLSPWSLQPADVEKSSDGIPDSPSVLAAARPPKLVIDQKGSGSRRNLFTSVK